MYNYNAIFILLPLLIACNILTNYCDITAVLLEKINCFETVVMCIMITKRYIDDNTH